MSSRGAGPTGHQWFGTPKDPKDPKALRASKGSAEPQARLALSVPPVHPEPKVPAATKDRLALEDPLALPVPKDKWETPARRALPGPPGPKAKGVLADLQDPLVSREQPATREPPGLKGKSGLKDPPGHWARQVSRRSK